MPYSVTDFQNHAEECVRLANSTADEVVQHDLLKLRQNYLATAERLRQQGFEPVKGAGISALLQVVRDGDLKRRA